MTRLLAIECSTDACSVALLDESHVAERFVVQAREHHRILLPLLMELLEQESVKLEQIDAIAYSAGPGSFTGLRLGVGVVQGLAFSLKKPAIPISSLAVTAQTYLQQYPETQRNLRVTRDARMGEVYFGVYRREGEGVTALAADALISLAAWEEKKNDWEDAIGVGFPERGDVEIYPRASAVAALAKSLWDAGKVCAAAEAMPIYLRESVQWQKWQPKSRPLV